MSSRTRVRASGLGADLLRFWCAAGSLIAAIVLANPAFGSEVATQPSKGVVLPDPPAFTKDWVRGTWVSRSSWAFAYFTQEDYLNPAKAPPNPPPFTAKAAAFYKRVREAASRGVVLFDSDAFCDPIGMPMRMKYGGGRLQFVITPDRVVMLFNDMTYRNVWMDGRPHPENYEPTFHGHSIGRWEGNSLVVDTVGIRSENTEHEVGIPKGDDVHLIERITYDGPDRFLVDMTVIDPDIFVRPWGGILPYERDPEGAFEESVCVRSYIQPDPEFGIRMVTEEGKPLEKAED